VDYIKRERKKREKEDKRKRRKKKREKEGKRKLRPLGSQVLCVGER
jgi:hypothetical protein